MIVFSVCSTNEAILLRRLLPRTAESVPRQRYHYSNTPAHLRRVSLPARARRQSISRLLTDAPTCHNHQLCHDRHPAHWAWSHPPYRATRLYNVFVVLLNLHIVRLDTSLAPTTTIIIIAATTTTTTAITNSMTTTSCPTACSYFLRSVPCRRCCCTSSFLVAMLTDKHLAFAIEDHKNQQLTPSNELQLRRAAGRACASWAGAAQERDIQHNLRAGRLQ